MKLNKNKIKKYSVRLVLIVLVSLGATALMSARAPKPPIYTTDKSVVATIASSFSEKGSVIAASQQEVVSPIDGTVTELLIASGSTVEVGQELFKIKSSSTARDSAAAYAQYTTALSGLRQAEGQRSQILAAIDQAKLSVLQAQSEVNLKNSGALNPKTLVQFTEPEKQILDAALKSANSQLASEQRKYDDIEAQITAAKSQINSGWESYKITQELTVLSETAGIATNLTIAPGSRVGPSSTIFPMIIANLSSPRVMLKINESDINKLSFGQSVQVNISAFRNKVFEGTIISIDSIGVNDQNVVTYNAYVVLKDSEVGLKPGMTAKVNFETAKKDNVISVPNSALRPFGSGKAVEVFDGTELETDKSRKTILIPVTVGIKDSTRTEIISGIPEGTEVILTKSTK
jgi:HlyD family secretion protein